MTEDLATWLRAQLDEDERVALAAGEQRFWQHSRLHDGDHTLHIGDRVISVGFEGGDPLRPVEAILIDRCSPSRVLAEVAAKRRLLDRYKDPHWHAPAIPRLPG